LLPGERVGSVAIRPESIRHMRSAGTAPDTAYSGQASVASIMPTGGSWIVELIWGEQKLFATTNTPPGVQSQDEVTFWVAQGDLHLFDNEGKRLPNICALSDLPVEVL